MSDKDTKEKGKKKKTKAKGDVAATEPTLDKPAKEDAPAKQADAATEASDDAVGVAPAAQASAPQIGIQSQYVKDLSFENPGAPGSLVGSTEPPDIQVNVEVQARALQTDSYEVALHITASGKNGDTTLFMLDLTYGAVCRVVGVPKDSIQPVLLVECPRLLFPFARRVLSDATRDGGFPPLMLNPIDFLSLYRQQQQSQSAAADKPAANA
ncbi:MAG: protein-export chaperone SecB [Rhodospirillaceae bacterium]|nr:protein-export chaperone SecB [Rhodospirillaceae bacterium]MBT3627154.1 protein-export chaperone SecB [Rhodospirillaceae bacterium]MBT3928671.1 protein-export chaperone SecB [Rhodospirillaceae bacterium]MBT4426615.1 protein-export chaperone SecB [Rhodospirillaceae bacterium]MBT5038369.1 protein-export chaperone SecB [Rhodospirillaceae bacterium]